MLNRFKNWITNKWTHKSKKEKQHQIPQKKETVMFPKLPHFLMRALAKSTSLPRVTKYWMAEALKAELKNAETEEPNAVFSLLTNASQTTACIAAYINEDLKYVESRLNALSQIERSFWAGVIHSSKNSPKKAIPEYLKLYKTAEEKGNIQFQLISAIMLYKLLLFVHDIKKSEEYYKKIEALYKTDTTELYRIFTYAEATSIRTAFKMDHAKIVNAENALLHSIKLLEPINDVALASAYRALARYYQIQNNIAASETASQKALAISEDLGNISGIALDSGGLGWTYFAKGDLEKAEKTLRRSMALHGETEEHTGLAQTYHNLGVVLELRGRLDEAETMYKRSYSVYDDLADEESLAKLLMSMGSLKGRNGDHESAEECFRNSAKLFEKMNDRELAIVAYGNLSIALSQQNQYEKSKAAIMHALALGDHLPDFPMIAELKEQLALLHLQQGNIKQAITMLASALRYFRKHNKNRFFKALIVAVDIRLMQERAEHAVRYAHRVITYAALTKDQLMLAEMAAKLADIYEINEDFIKARVWFARAAELNSILKRDKEYVRNMLGWSRALAAENEFDKALSAMNECVETAISQGDTHLQMMSYRLRANLCEQLAKNKFTNDQSQEENTSETSNIISEESLKYFQIAEDDFMNVIKLSEAEKNAEALAADYGQLGCLYISTNEWDKAEKVMWKSFILHEELDEYRLAGLNCWHLGKIHAARNETDKAIRMYHRAISLHKKAGLLNEVSLMILSLGDLLTDLRRFNELKSVFMELRATAIRLRNPLLLGDAEGSLGNVFLELGELSQALIWYRRALRWHIRTAAEEEQASDLSNIGLLFKKLGDTESAIRSWNCALQLYRNLNQDEEVALMIRRIKKISSEKIEI